MKLSQKRREWLTAQAGKYQQAAAQAAPYLEARGLADLAPTYHLGFVADPEPEHAPYRGRLAIPYNTPSGVVNFSFRCIQNHDCAAIEGHRKYLALPGERSLYNVQALHERHKAIALVEGEVDAMVVDTYVLPAVGVPGARHWKKWWRRLFEDYEKVFVVGDGDKAGEEFAESVGGKLGNASVVVFPEGEDANSILLSGGEHKLNELILGNG